MNKALAELLGNPVIQNSGDPRRDAFLREAIEDYNSAQTALRDESLSLEDRQRWTDILGELEAEISRLADGLDESQQRGESHES